jgi:hypothetical protein
MEGLLTEEQHRALIDRLNADAEDAVAIDPRSATPGSDYLEAIVRDPRQEKHFRARCARDLLAYERPRLAVTAITTPADFASRLEAAIARSEKAKVIEATSNGSARPERPSLPPAGRQPTNAAAPFPILRRL